MASRQVATGLWVVEIEWTRDAIARIKSAPFPESRAEEPEQYIDEVELFAKYLAPDAAPGRWNWPRPGPWSIPADRWIGLRLMDLVHFARWHVPRWRESTARAGLLFGKIEEIGRVFAMTTDDAMTGRRQRLAGRHGFVGQDAQVSGRAGARRRRAAAAAATNS